MYCADRLLLYLFQLIKNILFSDQRIGESNLEMPSLNLIIHDRL